MPTDAWPIQRRWKVFRKNDGNVDQVTFELGDLTAVALLGAAGLGKTHELRGLAAFEREQNRDIKICRLAEYSGSRDELHAHLCSLSVSATENTSIFLDALDESRVPLPRASLIVARWINTELGRTRAKLRITCRSAVWSGDLQQALDEYAGIDGCPKAYLRELTNEDIVVAASALGINASNLLEAIHSARADVLAKQPLTLSMLLRLYASDGEIPSTRKGLFEKCMLWLATDTTERFDLGTNIQLAPTNLLDAAERLACFTLLSGKDRVDLSDLPGSENLSWTDIGQIDNVEPRLDRDTLSAIGSSGLCDSDTPHTFHFAHRLYAEYLAGRRIARLLPHQGRSLLANPGGWQNGVAGALRETAAFAAMHSPILAQWTSTSDPEVVGLSDIADGPLRRQATLGLLEKCRNHTITDDQVSHLELRGFQYPGVETDLEPVLRERQPGCEDVVECAVALIESWKFSEMSDALAELVLDASAPFFARKTAAHGLLDFGKEDSRVRLLPLTVEAPGDSENQLRAVAALCNWPERISPAEMLDVISLSRSDRFHGMYENLLWTLDKQGFNAQGCRVKGLKWAKDRMGSLTTEDSGYRIAMRIVHAALQELNDVDIADALYQLLKHCTDRRLASPLESLEADELEARPEPSVSTTGLDENSSMRRVLIDVLAARSTDVSVVNFYSYHQPRLANQVDFEWLLERATDTSRPLDVRRNYATVAKWIHWEHSPLLVEAWLRVRDCEPIRSTLNVPIAVELDSEEARRERQFWLDSQERHHPETVEVISPPPRERVMTVLQRAEAESCGFFFRLCEELTLEPESNRYRFERFITATPGWCDADDGIRRRIVEVAKFLLSTDNTEIEEANSTQLNAIHAGGMTAIFLIWDQEPAWFIQQPSEWWNRWWWYILRELRIPLDREPDEPKIAIFKLLVERVPECIRGSMLRMAMCSDDSVRWLYDSLLPCIELVGDQEFDNALLEHVLNDEVDQACLQATAEYLLRRCANRAITPLLGLVVGGDNGCSEARRVSLAAALMNECPTTCWPAIASFINRRPVFGRGILEAFIHHQRFQRNENPYDKAFTELGPDGVYALIQLLFQLYPPESDPARSNRAYRVTPEHEARDWRSQVVSYLADKSDSECVKILRKLETELGSRYPWLRRPRARAERQLRLSQWAPIPLPAIAAVLSANDKRLLRSPEDVIDGICEALQDYQADLQLGGAVEDLWNTASGSNPSPKNEEHVSKKVCDAIRDYFETYAVTADREVQIRRRLVARRLGGQPGSETDVLVRVPASGATDDEAICVPLEVKRSCNDEAKKAIDEQLAGRYMVELDATHGIFVLAWFDLPNRADLSESFCPVWPTIAAAQLDLEGQAQKVREDRGFSVSPIVLDATLV